MNEHEPAKLTDMHSVRIPAALKNATEKMSPAEKSAMNTELRVVIARYVHMSNFDPSKYLSD